VGSGSKPRDDVSLRWLLEVNALFFGPPGEVTNPHFNAQARLNCWSERFDVKLIEVLSFFVKSTLLYANLSYSDCGIF
jgi:hypothetical protein